jgi:hypothetical protein
MKDMPGIKAGTVFKYCNQVDANAAIDDYGELVFYNEDAIKSLINQGWFREIKT